MAINVGRRRYVAMPHQILRRFQVHALAAEIGAVGVAKIVRRDGRIKGVRDDLVSVDLGTGGAITGAVEARPHPPQAGRGKHSAVLPVEEVARHLSSIAANSSGSGTKRTPAAVLVSLSVG